MSTIRNKVKTLIKMLTKGINTLVDILENLDGHNKGVLQQIIVDHAVENLNIAVISAGGKERVTLVVGDRANSLLMVSQGLVGLGRQIEIKPAETLVV